MHLPSVEELTVEVERLRNELNNVTTLRDGTRTKELAREYNHKEELLSTTQKYQALEAEILQSQALLESEDMRSLAEEEIARLSSEKAEVEKHLEELLIPRDAKDARDVILEIRAGAGGEEAALFAQELFRSYTRYAEKHKWSVHTLSTSVSEQSGFKEVVAEISGEDVFGTLKYERGVHRVQRIPATEKQGRIHTSTITVAVLPQAEEVDIVIRTEDLRVDTYRASGAGGQHVNKTSSAVRITHLPTNTVVAVQDERSQHKNREKAMSILRSRLLAVQEETRAKAEADMRRSQIGTGDRSEKIRTYNFPQDRITDHRIKESWGSIPLVMEGEWDAIFKTMREKDRQAALSAAAAS